MFDKAKPTAAGPDHILVFKKMTKTGPYYEYYAGPAEPKELRDWVRSYMTATVHGSSILLARISRYYYDDSNIHKNPYSLIEIKESIKLQEWQG